MAFSHIPFRPSFDAISRCWPLFIFAFLGLVYLAHRELSSHPLLTASDARKSQSLPPLASYGDAPRRKLPSDLTFVLVHYASTNITPQQTKEEISVTANILSRRGPCNFLVFGLGFDSPLWHALNLGGRTVFLEEDSSWIAQMARTHSYLKSYIVNYTTMVSEADELLEEARRQKEICGPDQSLLPYSKCRLALTTLPAEIYNTKWDVIMIDAPRGYFPEAPGRMSAIFTSAVMARKGRRKKSTDILIHDIDRPVEKNYSSEYFCSKNLIQSVGKLWHFQIFGEGQAHSKDFCTQSFIQSPS